MGNGEQNRAKFQRRAKFSQKRRPRSDDDFLWLVSLSDLMILLFIFFVVMFSFSHDKLKKADIDRILASLRNEALPEHPIEKIEKDLNEWVTEKELEEDVAIEKDGGDLLIVMKDTILFQSGASAPHAGGTRVIRMLKATLDSVPKPYRIGIEGHTDDSPIHTPQIADNWELSAQRSLAVLRTLNLSVKTLKRTIVMAYGASQPLAPNRNEGASPLSKTRRKTAALLFGFSRVG